MKIFNCILGVVLMLFIQGCGSDSNNTQPAINVEIKVPELNDLSRKGRIGTRVVEGSYEFFDKENSLTFAIKGYNYTQVQEYQWGGVTLNGHSTFNAEYYNAANTEALFTRLRGAKYNTVRVFLNSFTISEQLGSLNEHYIQNVADFIKTADEFGLSVIITLDSIPVSYYNTDLQTEDDIWWWNDQYIEQSAIDLELAFWQSLIQQLKTNLVPLEAILAYQIRNEFFFHPDHKPFSHTGVVVHSNGTTYDMAIEAEKNALLETSFLHWSSAVRHAIHEVDSDALVTVGFYAPAPLGTPSNTAIVHSELDFIDLHMYPQTATLSDYDTYFGLMENKEKLIIMGEFGIIGNDYQDAEEVKNILLNWKNNAVSNYHIDGWLLWAWSTGEGSELSFSDSEHIIFKALSD